MIYSIGHSTLDWSDFVEMLRDVNIDVLADIRSHPSSRWEQFQGENMKKSLSKAKIRYEFVPQLGGWTEDHYWMADKFLKHNVDLAIYSKGKFPKQRIAKVMKNDNINDKPSWTNQGLWDYEWFMTLPEFLQAADDMIRRVRKTGENIGIMCCEVLWWKCHRSLVADYMLFRGETVTHLQPKFTPHTQCIGNRLDRYEDEVMQIWLNWAKNNSL